MANVLLITKSDSQYLVNTTERTITGAKLSGTANILGDIPPFIVGNRFSVLTDLGDISTSPVTKIYTA